MTRFKPMLRLLSRPLESAMLFALAPRARNHHGFDVGEAGMQHRRDRVMRRPQVQRARVDDDEVSLLAGLEAANRVGQAQRPGSLSGRP